MKSVSYEKQSLLLQKINTDTACIGMKACFVMAASGTDKTVWPSHFDQILPTGLFRFL